MAYKTALRLTSAIIVLLGAFALIFNIKAYQLLAGISIVTPATGATDESSMSVWATLSVLRLASSLLLCLAVVVWYLSDIEGADIQRRICRALSAGFAVTFLVAFVQGIALSLTTEWVLAGLALIAAVAHYRLSIEPKTVPNQAGGKTTSA
jgi:VIT1/CCC1 family predicted Fe2+/Mn2+ transporter